MQCINWQAQKKIRTQILKKYRPNAVSLLKLYREKVVQIPSNEMCIYHHKSINRLQFNPQNIKISFYLLMNFNQNFLFPNYADVNYYLYSYLSHLKVSLDSQLSKMIQLNKNLINSQICNHNSKPVKEEHNEDIQSSNSQSRQKIKNHQNSCYRNQHLKYAELQSIGDRNDTKNIPKNYGKAILTFIKKNSSKIKPLLKKNNVDFLQLMTQIKRIRKKVNSIQGLRKMWGVGDEENKVKKCIRILSYTFMRKHCLTYIFHSRVKNYATHIKYRKRIIQGLRKPEQFTNIKQY